MFNKRESWELIDKVEMLVAGSEGNTLSTEARLFIDWMVGNPGSATTKEFLLWWDNEFLGNIDWYGCSTFCDNWIEPEDLDSFLKFVNSEIDLAYYPLFK